MEKTKLMLLFNEHGEETVVNANLVNNPKNHELLLTHLLKERLSSLNT